METEISLEKMLITTVSIFPELVHVPKDLELVYVPKSPELVHVPKGSELVYIQKDPELVYVPRDPELVHVPKGLHHSQDDRLIKYFM